MIPIVYLVSHGDSQLTIERYRTTATTVQVWQSTVDEVLPTWVAQAARQE